MPLGRRVTSDWHAGVGVQGDLRGDRGAVVFLFDEVAGVVKRLYGRPVCCTWLPAVLRALVLDLAQRRARRAHGDHPSKVSAS